MAELMEAVTSLAKRRGIAFQSSEIYGGLRSSWDYGPLGVELRRNVRTAWWRSMVQLHDGSPATKHVTTNVIGEVDDDGRAATARSYFTVL